METNAGSVSEQIAAAMSAAERSKKWTAEKAGIPVSTFARKLGGYSDFTIGEVARVALALGVKPSSLLPDEFQAVA